MDQAAYHLGQVSSHAVLEAIQELCEQRGWRLMAAQVRSDRRACDR